MKLWYLYLRSRLAGWAVVFLAVSGVVAWFMLWQIVESGVTADNAREAVTIPLIVIPLLPAVVIGASTRSPFGDTELSVSRSLPALRFGHLTGLLLLGVISLAIASTGWSLENIEWEFIRNLAGYAGLAFLGARILGSGVCWVVPLGYGVVTLMLDHDSRWTWMRTLPADCWSVMVAAALVIIGLLAVTLQQPRDSGDDVS